MPTFALPTLLYGLLLAVPALVAIYLLRQRARRHEVSSLMFWQAERQVRASGRRWERWQSSPLFWLELIALALLLLAAATPLWRKSAASQPLVVVLDDSFSMQAGVTDTPQSRARQRLERELPRQSFTPLRFVLASARPQLLSETANTSQAITKLLSHWTCGAAQADLSAAVAFAFELGGARARVLVVSDHAPTESQRDSRLQWWAFGRAAANLAFVNAARSSRGAEDLVLLEIANLSAQAQISNFKLQMTEPLPAEPLSFQPNEIKRLTYRLKAGTPALQARLGEDALSLDNTVTLLPERARPLRVAVQVNDGNLRALVEQALRAAENITITTTDTELLITDGNVTTDVWALQIHAATNATSYLGPFVIDRSHPLTDGLSLGGVVWAANPQAGLPGRPLITAGNIYLLTEVIAENGVRVIHLSLTPALSTLQQTPNWPVLLWNLCHWRAAESAGLRATNIRLGGEAELLAASNSSNISLIDPAQRARRLTLTERLVKVPADKPGLYHITDNGITHSFAANALQKDESDLTQAATGDWGQWAQSAAFSWEYRNVAWAAVLLAFITLSLHAWWAKTQA